MIQNLSLFDEELWLKWNLSGDNIRRLNEYEFHVNNEENVSTIWCVPDCIMNSDKIYVWILMMCEVTIGTILNVGIGVHPIFKLINNHLLRLEIFENISCYYGDGIIGHVPLNSKDRNIVIYLSYFTIDGLLRIKINDTFVIDLNISRHSILKYGMGPMMQIMNRDVTVRLIDAKICNNNVKSLLDLCKSTIIRHNIEIDSDILPKSIIKYLKKN